MPNATQDDPRPAHDVTGTPDAKRSLAGAVQSRFWVFFGSIWLMVGLPFVLLAGYFIVQERQLATTERVVEANIVFDRGVASEPKAFPS